MLKTFTSIYKFIIWLNNEGKKCPFNLRYFTNDIYINIHLCELGPSMNKISCLVNERHNSIIINNKHVSEDKCLN